MKVGFKKTKNGFEYTGDLCECIEYAENKLLQLNQKLPYISKRFLDEKKRFDTLQRSIENCNRFINLARNEIERRIFEEKAFGLNYNLNIYC